MTQSSQSPERVFSAIFTNGVFRIRTRATIGPQNASLNRAVSRASALSQSASHILPAVGKLRTAIERTNSLVALAVRPFTRRGHIGILNLRWPFKASSSLSFGSFVKHRQEPASVQNVLRSPKALSLFAAAHVHQHDTRRDGNVRIEIGEVRNVVR